ncbi:MAG: cysteine rich repeat-containing protein, partial [Betaproteobacteria bacterium]
LAAAAGGISLHIEFNGGTMTRVVFAALLASAFATAVLAKEGGDPFAACKADYEKFCKSVQPGDGRIVKCMMENKGRVSSGCAAVLEKKQQHERHSNEPKHDQQANKPKNIKTGSGY